MPNAYGSDATLRLLKDEAEALAAAVLAPNAAEVDAEAAFPQAGVDALATRNFLGLCVGRELGGRGEGTRAFVTVVEELATACASTAMIYVMHIAAAQAIAASATLGQREHLLRAIAAGRHLTTLALSEKGSRSQFWAPVSRLQREGGGYLTSARKSFVTSARRADFYVSTAQAPNAASALESTVYLVRRADPAVKPQGAFKGLGLRGNDSVPVDIDALAVAPSDLLTPLGEGAKMVLEVILPWFAIGTAAMANGLCRAAVAATTAHVTATTFEHTGTGLRDLPNVRARLAQMSVRTEQARALLGRTLGEMESPSEQTPLFVLQTRLSSLEAALDVTDLAMKTCGGAAFSRVLGVERIFRDARAGWVMAPTVDHLNDFIGRAMTGLPLFS